MPVPRKPVQVLVATIAKLKARAGTIFRNCKKSNDASVSQFFVKKTMCVVRLISAKMIYVYTNF